MERLDDGLLRRLDYLVAQNEEALDVEFKGPLDLSTDEHRDDLAKALLAMANHGGGFVVVGVPSRNAPVGQPVSSVPLPTHDDVNDVSKSYADPVFHCNVHKITSGGNSYAVVVVPGGHPSPIRAKRDGPKHVKINRYYVRKPGPASEEAKTPDEWNQLLQRCIRNRKDEMFDQLRAIFEGNPTQKPAPKVDVLKEWALASANRLFERVDMKDNPYAFGYWTFSYRVLGSFGRPSLAQFRKMLIDADNLHVTGWPPWMFIPREPLTPKPVGETIEAWLYEGRDHFMNHADFWRASPDGLLFQLAEFQEDSSPKNLSPGTLLDVTLPVWRVGERMLHAARFAPTLAGPDAEVEFLVEWSGLRGRTLGVWASRERMFPFWAGSRTCHTDKIESRIAAPAKSIQTQLPELVSAVTKRLYEAFDFFELDDRVVRGELRRMVNREY